jgi:hypothetical protein
MCFSPGDIGKLACTSIARSEHKTGQGGPRITCLQSLEIVAEKKTLVPVNWTSVL